MLAARSGRTRIGCGCAISVSAADFAACRAAATAKRRRVRRVCLLHVNRRTKCAQFRRRARTYGAEAPSEVLPECGSSLRNALVLPHDPIHYACTYCSCNCISKQIHKSNPYRQVRLPQSEHKHRARHELHNEEEREGEHCVGLFVAVAEGGVEQQCALEDKAQGTRDCNHGQLKSTLDRHSEW